MSRPFERRLLVRVAAALALAYAGLGGARHSTGEPWWQPSELAVLSAFVVALALLHRGLERTDLRGDEALVAVVGLLTGLGLVMQFSLQREPLAWPPSPRWAIYPLAPAALAIAAWICRDRLHWLDGVWWLCGLAACGLLVLLLRSGTDFRGARFGPGLTTPSELLKPLMVVYLAGFLKRRRSLLELVLFGVIWTVPQVLLVKQSDLGLVVILGGLALSLFYVASGRTRVLLLGLGAATLVTVAVYFASELGVGAAQHGQRRLDLWLHPWADPDGLGYQSLQALFAVRGGALEGMGLGRGLPGSVPLVSSDFAYAALAESFGWVGCTLILAAYLALFRRGYRIAALADEPFRQRLAIGCVTVLAVQTLLNVGGVLRLAPITGITLPFISHGGSSLMVSWALTGLVLAVGHDLEMGERRRRQRRGAAEHEGQYARQDSNLRPSD